MRNITEFLAEWNAINKIEVFEIEVVDKRTTDHDWISFNIDIRGNKFIARHVALSREQDKSKYIPFIDYDIDIDFSIDEHLQDLRELCMNAIIDSEYYRLK